VFSAYIEEARTILAEESTRRCCTAFRGSLEGAVWPHAKDQIIFADETGCDFGSAGSASISLLLLTERPDLVQDAAISLIGPDIPACRGREMAFGKVVMVQGRGFTEDNLFRRYQEMSLQRFDLDLDGCVSRGLPRQNREWIRVADDTLRHGFSFETLGGELYRHLRAIDYVDAVEIAFITSSTADVEAFDSLSRRLGKAVQAMDKMVERLAYDCDECECRDVCNEVEGLRRMHEHVATRK